MNGRRPTHRWPCRVLVAATGVIALAACGGHVGTAAPSATSSVTTAATTSSASSSARQAALAAYDGMWADEQQAALTANYQSPLLAQHASGAALSLLVQGLSGYQRQHEVVKGQPVTHPQVTSLTPAAAPTRATITDCFDDTHWLVYKDTGPLEDNVPGGHRRIQATVVESGGVWKVTQFSGEAEGTC